MKTGKLFELPQDKEIINKLHIRLYINKINYLYEETHEYLDPHFLKEIKSGCKYKLHQRWVEMVTLYKLLVKDVKLLKLDKKEGQPDAQIKLNDNLMVWIECVSPNPGSYEDSLEIKHHEDYQPKPIEYLLPRVTNSIINKKDQHLKQIKTQANNCFIIPILLINVALINHGIISQYAGLFQGWNEQYTFIDGPEIYTKPCREIPKPSTHSSIPIGYFDDKEFPFWAVVFSNDSLTLLGHNTPQNLLLLNPKFTQEPICDELQTILNAALIDYTTLRSREG